MSDEEIEDQKMTGKKDSEDDWSPVDTKRAFYNMKVKKKKD